MDIFGPVADRYETARPGYPPELADAILAYHGGTPAAVAEIGAGTGKGTEILTALGAPVTCIEPDPEMAAVLSARHPQARVHIGHFEQWPPPPGGADILAAAMSWHWLDPATRNPRARQALTPQGTLALFGHHYGYADPNQATAIRTALDALDPTATERPPDWMAQDVRSGGHFTDIHIDRFQRTLPLSRAQFLALVSTFGPFLTRPPELQRRGLEVLGRLADDFGGTVVLNLRTTLTLARPLP